MNHIANAITRNFGRYEITDTYGTRRRAWSIGEAMDWLRYCSPGAMICDAWTGRFIAARNFA